MKRFNFKWCALVLLPVFISACGGFKAQRVDTKTADDKSMEITDEWVDGDTIRVVDETLSRIDRHKRFKRYLRKFGDKDLKLFVANIQNNTSEAYFPVTDLEEALLEKLSDSETFLLLDARARKALLKEITYQSDGMVNPAEAKRIGMQSGADAMIFGTVNMQPRRRDGKTIKTYTVNFRLTDLETGQELVRTRAKINKFSEQKSGW